MSVPPDRLTVLENKERLGNKMTNTKKCKCEKAHTFLDVMTEDNNKVIYRQKWHTCFSCGRFQLAKWIRLHEIRCNPKHFYN